MYLKPQEEIVKTINNDWIINENNIVGNKILST